MEKKCCNCRHYFKTADEEPCIGCHNHEHFEPAVDALVRAKTLDTAKDMITGHREQDYGSPENNFQTIADLWSTYTGTKISALDVAMMMCLLKIARIKSGGGTGDSFVDLAGYAGCGAEIYELSKDN